MAPGVSLDHGLANCERDGHDGEEEEGDSDGVVEVVQEIEGDHCHQQKSVNSDEEPESYG